jgi:hypothetical protein
MLCVRGRRPIVRSVRWTLFSLLLVPGAILLGCAKNDEPQKEQQTVVTKDSGWTVVLETDKDPDPLKPGLKKHTDVDHVRWENKSGAERTIHFKSDWPFLEPLEDIKVPATGTTPWYSLNHEVTAKAYPYEVTPPLRSGPPDEPSISVSE